LQLLKLLELNAFEVRSLTLQKLTHLAAELSFIDQQVKMEVNDAHLVLCSTANEW
jgi:hypothetical protein